MDLLPECTASCSSEPCGRRDVACVLLSRPEGGRRPGGVGVWRRDEAVCTDVAGVPGEWAGWSGICRIAGVDAPSDYFPAGFLLSRRSAAVCGFFTNDDIVVTG